MLTSWLTGAIKQALETENEVVSSSPGSASDSAPGRLYLASQTVSSAFDEEVLEACVEEALDDLLPTFLSLTATLIMFEECHVLEGKGGKLRLTPQLCVSVLGSVPVSLSQPMRRRPVRAWVQSGCCSHRITPTFPAGHPTATPPPPALTPPSPAPAVALARPPSSVAKPAPWCRLLPPTAERAGPGVLGWPCPRRTRGVPRG